jgi:DNA-binding transcriptional LysR family regulator
MDTDLLKNFIIVAHYLNMTKAAEFRNISPSAVSKKVTALEHELGGVTLMQRYPGRLYLTEEGQVALVHAEKILREIESIQSLMAGPTAALTGALTIHTMRGLGLEWLSTQLPEFRELYPDIVLEVLFDGLKPFALASQNSGVYAGLSTREPMGDSIYIWKRLASFYFYPYAHQSYLEKQGTPTTFAELDHHKIIRCEDGEQYSQDQDALFNSLN